MKPKIFFFVLVGAALAMLAGSVYGYLTVSRELAASKKSLEGSMAELSVASDQVDGLMQLQKQLQTLQPLVPKLDTFLPATKKQSEVTLQLQMLAANAGMSLDSLAFQSNPALPSSTSQTMAAPGGVLALPTTILLTGSYSQLQTFLQQLESLNRFINVTSLNISKAQNGLSFSMNLNAYVKP